MYKVTWADNGMHWALFIWYRQALRHMEDVIRDGAIGAVLFHGHEIELSYGTLRQD